MTRTPSTTSRTSGIANDSDLTALVDALHGETADVFTTMDWAEDEIAQASRRHPTQADLLYHAFPLLKTRDLGTGFATEFVYRAHAAELLHRLATGADTRPATAAELCVVCADVSEQVPLHAASAGLYFRMWTQAFPGHHHTATQAAQQEHYESLYRAQIDDLERELRRKVADPQRRLADVDCDACHHGRDVTCRFSSTGNDHTPPATTRRRRRPADSLTTAKTGGV